MSTDVEFVLQRWSVANGEWLDGGWYGDAETAMSELHENKCAYPAFLYRVIRRETTETVISEGGAK
jgi:hypothetical protein